MTPITLPGDLVSPVAGPLLRRGSPVIVAFDAHASISGVCIIDGVIAVRDGGLADIYEVGIGELYDVAPDQVALDLSDPAGRDRAARWLAEHHGLKIGDGTAPAFWRWTPAGGGWALGVPGPDSALGAIILHSGDIIGTENTRGQTWITVPGISALTDPAEALAAACMAAVGRAG